MDKIIYYLPLVTAVTLIVTAGILLWYTKETRSLREETHKLAEQSVLQTEIQIRPVIIIIPDKETNLAIKNIGNGIALNIETEDITIIPADKNKILRFSPEKIDVMSQGEKIGMLGLTFMGNQQLSEEPSFLGNLDPRHANCNYEFKVKYEDINEEKYQTIGKTGKDGVHIKEIGRV